MQYFISRKGEGKYFTQRRIREKKKAQRKFRNFFAPSLKNNL